MQDAVGGRERTSQTTLNLQQNSRVHTHARTLLKLFSGSPLGANRFSRTKHTVTTIGTQSQPQSKDRRYLCMLLLSYKQRQGTSTGAKAPMMDGMHA
mmetsp:Transcript_154/g.312  ORF Transcript_154/g.312 Transcript_154/m.312 type:complete len:97 (+) Transcript_154:722-1012(+)